MVALSPSGWAFARSRTLRLLTAPLLALAGAAASGGLAASAHAGDSAPCVEPPPNMLGWWPFDETAGLIAQDLTAYSHDGAHQPAVGGPTPVPGLVAGALSFDGVDDLVAVPAAAVLDVSCGAFSVDLWVKRDAPGPNADLETLVSHYLSNGGWIFGVDTFSGALMMILEGNSQRCAPMSTATVPVGVWTHVAVTLSACCPAGQRTVTFYINGVAAGTSLSSCCDLTSLNGPAQIRMGNGVWLSDWFDGTMDEVEYFCRVLSPAEIAALHSAGASGKCKASCHASWDRELCFNFGFSTQVDATIVNNSTVGRTFQYTIAANGGCPLSSTTYAPTSGSVFVGPGGQATVVFTATIAAPQFGQGCYDVTFTNLSNNTTCTATGSFISDVCGIFVLPDPLIAVVGIDEIANASFRVTAGGDGADFPYSIVAMPSSMSSSGELTPVEVSLNGLPPGTVVKGMMSLAPNTVGEIPLTIQYVTCGATFAWTDVILYTPTSEGILGPNTSFGVRMVEAQSCPGDLNVDGVVNGGDLGILLADWGTAGPGDLNGDGVIDGADLGILLGLWGPC